MLCENLRRAHADRLFFGNVGTFCELVSHHVLPVSWYPPHVLPVSWYPPHVLPVSWYPPMSYLWAGIPEAEWLSQDPLVLEVGAKHHYQEKNIKLERY